MENRTLSKYIFIKFELIIVSSNETRYFNYFNTN